MGGNLTKVKHKTVQKHYLTHKLPIVGGKLYDNINKGSCQLKVNARPENVSRIPSPYIKSSHVASSDSEQSWKMTSKAPAAENSFNKGVENNRKYVRKQSLLTPIQSRQISETTETEGIIGSNYGNLNVEDTQQQEENGPQTLQKLDKCNYTTKYSPEIPVRSCVDYQKGDDGNCLDERSLVKEFTETLDSNYPKYLPTGDIVDSQISPKILVNRFPQKQSSRPSCLLSGKPPTPPSKPPPTRLKTPNSSTHNSPSEKAPSSGQRNRKPTRSLDKNVMQRNAVPRCNSLPRPATAEHGSRSSREPRDANGNVRTRRLSAASQQCLDDSQMDKSQCLARIEYTFYISDTEAHQRPFYDRRVEAVARACQCNICLHIPPQGHRPVLYKGMRVLPVTISAHSMITLKRCIARLDMQYPFFNVKAFCPTDMY